jgi:class 3 adenylate cyclase
MLTLNQMMADLVSTLRKYEARVSGFRGDGFLAMLRGENHALRAVRAALGLVQAIAEFNEPRTILKLPLFTTRIGIASGEMFLGNLGTYDKMDFTAIGTTANLGARLEAHAEPGLPCISRGTYDLVEAHFIFKEGNPRKADLKGLGNQEIWDVVRER